jgi:dephospho-CoA kinase
LAGGALSEFPSHIAIGLTGGPGVGKSEAAKVLQQLKFRIINADKIGHELLIGNKNIKVKLIKLFGKGIVAADDSLDRRAIGQIVFADPMAMQEFNRIIHPALLKELKRRLIIEAKSGSWPVVVDAALIFEWGIADWFDYIFVVTAAREKRLHRLRAQGLNQRQASQRIASQIPQRDKIALADFVIVNDSTRASLHKQVKNLVDRLKNTFIGNH